MKTGMAASASPARSLLSGHRLPLTYLAEKFHIQSTQRISTSLANLPVNPEGAREIKNSPALLLYPAEVRASIPVYPPHL